MTSRATPASVLGRAARRADARSAWYAGPAVLLLLALLTCACSGPDVEQQARQRLRDDVALARTAVLEALAGDSPSRADVQAALDRAVGPGAVLGERATGSGTDSVQVVVTVTVEEGGGVGYASWTSRACVTFARRDGGTDLTVQDIPCPDRLTPDPGPADEVLSVAG